MLSVENGWKSFLPRPASGRARPNAYFRPVATRSAGIGFDERQRYAVEIVDAAETIRAFDHHARIGGDAHAGVLVGIAERALACLEAQQITSLRCVESVDQGPGGAACEPPASLKCNPEASESFG